MRHKYRAVPTIIDGIRFDSKRESQIYCELKILARANKINALEVHPRLDLHTTGMDGIKRKIGCAEFDFAYWDCERKERVWVDVKGFDPPMSKWKRKHTEAEHGIKITIRK